MSGGAYCIALATKRADRGDDDVLTDGVNRMYLEEADAAASRENGQLLPERRHVLLLDGEQQRRAAERAEEVERCRLVAEQERNYASFRAQRHGTASAFRPRAGRSTFVASENERYI